MSPVNNSLTREKVDSIAAKLRGLSEREAAAHAVSKQEAIKLLSKEIKALRQRGYSIRDIAEILSNEGVPFTPATLSNFLWRAGQSKKSTRNTSERKPATRDTPPARPAVTSSKGSFYIRPDTPNI